MTQHDPLTEKPAEIDTPGPAFFAIAVLFVLGVAALIYATLFLLPPDGPTEAQRIHDAYMQDCVKDGHKPWQCAAMLGPRP